MNIGNILPHHARFRPDRTALICGDQRLTYSELNQSVNQIANAIRTSGIRKGDKIAMLLPNCRELWELYWAIAKLGAVSVPLSPLLRGNGLRNQLNNADTALLVTTESVATYLDPIFDTLRLRHNDVWLTDAEEHHCYDSFYRHKHRASDEEPPEADIHSDDLYNIIYSSGTTGEPKGIMHTHRVRAAYMTLFSSYYRMTPECVVLHSGSIIFNGSFLTTMPVMFLGGTFILHENFDVENLVRTIKEEGVTHTMLVPSQIAAALEHADFTGEHIASLEMILSVGAPLHQKYKEEINRRIPGAFYELYGLTEGFVTILDKTDFHKKPGSVGCPPQFFDMRIVDDEGRDLPPAEVGEIVGRGPILMAGYYKDPMRTRDAIKDGWLHSGDLGYVDEDGYLFLVDRKKDMIISGGVNIYPKDIEEVVIEHPDVQEVAVFGVPDESWGEALVAAVVLKPPSGARSDELKSWVNDRVDARFHKLKAVYIMANFPRNVAGKTLKREIKRQYLESEQCP
ncbi:class I adenylate-forming enzyme family protein [Candidatus Thiosymbion oneisti]|uniref:class I adenylate-forming enzyme family protein n=1 Tax=Candidatus Thiosymbion oneisti TaxID=589554 RepID=UPI000A85F53B|nr:AMP-binding protein [Candidatus Thiosymbion oneisti]